MERQCAMLATNNITTAVREAVKAQEGFGLQACMRLLQLKQSDENFLFSAAGWVDHAARRLDEDKVDWAAVGLVWVGLGLLNAKIQQLRSVSDWERRESLASASHEVSAFEFLY
ncbi:hypothetical protein PR048_004563 [Dryococelus australis]|uniref:Uncharacterized protein n=1 Tax=Dryococelus australis TaxID=614101 RepID=A0ABQ9I7Q2_9NEOP|nr:hypothetical protein PR048_004563 [Dryococelus australis]